MLPFVDDFAMFEENYEATLPLANRIFALLASLELNWHPTKGNYLPIMVGEHLGMILDFEKGEFQAPTEKLKSIAVLAKTLLCRAASHKQWVSVKNLACLAGKAQFLHLAIPLARFFLRELHDVVKIAKSWSGSVKVTSQLKRDLEWWTQVPSHHNGAPIWKPIENAYLQCDSICYGWGAVLNDCVEARGFWGCRT